MMDNQVEIGTEEDEICLSYGKRRKLNCPPSSSGSNDDNDLVSPVHRQHGESSLSSDGNHYPNRFLHAYLDANGEDMKTAVIFDDGKGILEKLSYGELDRFSELIKQEIEKSLSQEESRFIGVMCTLGRLYPALIIGILRSGKAFYNISCDNSWEGSVEDGVKHLSLKYIIIEGAMMMPCSISKYSKFVLRKVFDYHLPADRSLHFCVYEVVQPTNVQGEKLHSVTKQALTADIIAYAIQTSGTTGKRKTVIVPHASICPNVEDFIYKSWSVSSEDVVFGTAPPTFDPHIVELFATLGAGATILYTTSDVKLNGLLLSKLLTLHCVTILQITPSVFRRLYQSVASRDCFSSIRLVSFGGEKCPMKEELRDMMSSEFLSQNAQLQNIYGVTEVSCWASVCNIDLNTNDEITVGSGIMDTEISLENGEIVISSPIRRCYIIDSSSQTSKSSASNDFGLFKYYTGDFGRGTEAGIVFEGRKDRVVKRNGMKVHLHCIEDMALGTGLVNYAECKLYEGKIYLLVKLRGEYDHLQKSLSTSNMAALLPALNAKLDLPLSMYPDFVISLKYIPLNSNGKLDFTQIIKLLIADNCDRNSQTFSITSQQLIKSLEAVWRSCTYSGVRSIDTLLKENFFQVGGDSIAAARFIESAFATLKLFGSDAHRLYEPELLKILMKQTFGCVVELFSKITSVSYPITANIASLDSYLLPETQETLVYVPHEDSTCSEFEYALFENVMIDDIYGVSIFNNVDDCRINNSLSILFPVQLVTAYDFTLGLCVDASPALVQYGVFTGRSVIGCHGGVLLCLDLPVLRQNPKNCNRAVVWKQRLPNRIEASVTICETGLYGYVGCHDCNFYKFSLSNGAIICFSKCNAPVRSTAALSADHNCVLFIDSDNCIYCANSTDLNTIWVQSSYKLLATVTPLIFRNFLYVPTLDKGLIAVDIHTGSEIFTCADEGMNSPSSSPILGFVRNNNNKKRKHSLVFNATSAGVDGRNAKNGSLSWQYKMTTLATPKTIQQPIFNACCNNIIVFSPSNSYLELIDPYSGKAVKTVHDLKDLGTPALLHCSERSNSRHCVLFSKQINSPQLVLASLHSSAMYVVKTWFTTSDFETFSKPASWGEFILFGGRDNKLHVIKCNYTMMK